ncbi:DsbA family protein [Primorskyibacter sp. 2E107]|uniref:DsbA family protein n=1 Tax=Primorskyibacter sp. 2E107 TaxID=3403458 RepID=UPI003AF4F11A
MTHTVTLRYIFDPLCGWCYGASETIAALSAHPQVEVIPMPCGLFSGRGARSMDGFAAHAWQADQRIAGMTGRTFSEAYRRDVLGAKGGKLDSSVATLALTAVAEDAPEREIEMLKVLQEARYVGGKDVTSRSVVAALLTDCGLPDSAARVTSPDRPLLQSVQTRIAASQSLMAEFGLNGVPAVLIGSRASRPLDSGVLYAGTAKTLAALGLA